MTNEVTFGLVHGSWHGAWCWEPLEQEFRRAGYRSVAMDLPIENPAATFDDYADVVVEHLKDEPEIILVGHSRGGNVIPRAAGRLATSKLVFLNSSFEPATVGHPTTEELKSQAVPYRNSQQFLDSIIPLEQGMTEINPEMAKELFFWDCPPDVQEQAVAKLRPQRRYQAEPVLEVWPELPQEYILCEEDRVIFPAWSEYAARNWLGIEPIRLAGGHSPFLSRPKELAELLISLTN
jgi:pimeloyl-ACP methyl ester carboxylesterase